MSWATTYIDKLKKGEVVKFRPRGNSMEGIISSGQLVTVTPLKEEEIKIGDVVLCKVKGSQFLHLVKAIKGEQYQIGNNKGFINGWTSRNCIYGICVRVEP